MVFMLFPHQWPFAHLEGNPLFLAILIYEIFVKISVLYGIAPPSLRRVLPILGLKKQDRTNPNDGKTNHERRS